MLKKLGVALLAAALLGSCGVDNAFDCQSVCDRYQTCFDSDYDVGACAARCRDASDDDNDYEREADVCNACIDERSCGSATFNCAGSCGSIVP